jgi:hypothetical protein
MIEARSFFLACDQDDPRGNQSGNETPVLGRASRVVHWLLYFNLASDVLPYNSKRRSRSAFMMTENELNVIAALAIIGLNSQPKKG